MTLILAAKPPQMLAEILSAPSLHPTVTRRLLGVLTAPPICGHAIAPKSAPLYQRLLDSPLFTPPPPGFTPRSAGAEHGCRVQGAGGPAAGCGMGAYMEHLPSLAREIGREIAKERAAPAGGSAAPSASCFTQVISK